MFRILFIISMTLCATTITRAQSPFPFSVDETHITVWNGTHYVPLFIKGVNLGVAVPGTFPGQMAASKEQYERWFGQMHELGFNTIRIYTLHFPRFYEALRNYNLANPQYPILVLHGVWLEEEFPGYDGNLFDLTDAFDQEMQENVRAVHGDVTIPQRFGKAYGTYNADISPWVIGYIIGREVYPSEIITTNQRNAEITSYNGRFFSIRNTAASEAWFTERLDRLVAFQQDRYNTQRPVSFSSWPTLDPLTHPTETNSEEDIVSLDISGIDFSRAKAGLFASYHAYPYYPDFISRDPRYQTFSDHLGQNSYLGYLTYLKQHYHRFPLIIAEFGATSSWGNAHFSHSGIHHGGYDEREQGDHTMRMLQNIHQSGSGGGIMFSWLDEWFKQTWIVNPKDFDPDRRILWHNVTAAEQNYGIIGFRKPRENLVQSWETFCQECGVQAINAGADYAYLHFELEMLRHPGTLDTLWLALDTYRPDLGESVLPNGAETQQRAEFALMVTPYTAELYVTEAYDLYGIWHGTSAPEQRYRSVATDGAPWRLVRWKNNSPEREVQFIGKMRVNRLDLPKTSLDAVRITDQTIQIRLPWTLLNMSDPSRGRVIHFQRDTDMQQTLETDGVHVSVYYRGETYKTATRFIWPHWNLPEDVEEYPKDGYAVIGNEQPLLPGNPVARADSFSVSRTGTTMIPPVEGLLQNDWSLDRQPMFAVIDRAPEYGILNMSPDGGFTYTMSDEDVNTDSFTYRVRAGYHWSEPAVVTLKSDSLARGTAGFVRVFPNPTGDVLEIRSTSRIDQADIYNTLGQRQASHQLDTRQATLNVRSLAEGVYFIRLQSGRDVTVKKITVYR